MKYLWVVVVFLLSSCAAVDTSYKGSDAGYALISLELDYEKGFFVDKYYDYVSFSGKSKGSQNDNPIGVKLVKYLFKSSRDAGFYENDNLVGQVYLIRLMPGEYVIDGYSAMRQNQGYFFNEGVNVPFTIKPNQITYLGNFHAVETWQRRLLGLARVKVGAYFVVTDTHDNDLRLAKLLNPNVDIENYNISIPELESTLSPRLVKERTTKFDDK